MSMSLTNVQQANLVLGYCCINTHLRDLGIFTSRTCRLQTILENGIGYSYKLAHQNIDDLAPIFRWNARNKIYNYRMSSEIFPFATHLDYYQHYDIEQFRDKLVKLGKYAKRCGQRLTFHPGQYNQLTSLNDNVVEKSIIDIDFHAKILDMMNVDNNGVIIIHGGSKQDGKENSLARLEKNFHKLSPSAQKRLTLENCEMVYSIQDLLPLSFKLNIPIIVDIHHHNINPGTKPINELIQKVIVIWKKRNIIPLFHISESKPGIKITDSITARRAHSDFVTEIPKCFLDLSYNHRIFIDIEAKQKEQAVLQLYKKYNYN